MHRVGCRSGLLTRGRAPQSGATPLYIAAHQGHQEVVQLLVKEGADKDAPREVTRGGAWMLGAQTAHVFLVGGCSTAADLQRAVEGWSTVRLSMDENRSD